MLIFYKWWYHTSKTVVRDLHSGQFGIIRSFSTLAAGAMKLTGKLIRVIKNKHIWPLCVSIIPWNLAVLKLQLLPYIFSFGASGHYIFLLSIRPKTLLQVKLISKIAKMFILFWSNSITFEYSTKIQAELHRFYLIALNIAAWFLMLFFLKKCKFVTSTMLDIKKGFVLHAYTTGVRSAPFSIHNPEAPGQFGLAQNRIPYLFSNACKRGIFIQKL